jgi:hypothetical protein
MRLCVALVLFLSTGCAYRPANARAICTGMDCYEVGVLGPAWKAVTQDDGSAGYFNKAIGGVILSTASCRDDAEAAPLSSLTAHLLIGYTDRHERSSELVALSGREALRSVIDAKLDGVPIVLDLYVMKRNGCVFDLSYAAPPAGYDSGLADFQRFIAGFSQLPRPTA